MGVRGLYQQATKVGDELADFVYDFTEELIAYEDYLGTILAGGFRVKPSANALSINDQTAKWNKQYQGIGEAIRQWRDNLEGAWNGDTFELQNMIDKEFGAISKRQLSGIEEDEIRTFHPNAYKRGAQSHDREIMRDAKRLLRMLDQAVTFLKGFHKVWAKAPLEGTTAWLRTQELELLEAKIADYTMLRNEAKAMIASGYLDLDRMINDFNKIFPPRLVMKESADTLIQWAIHGDPVAVVEWVFRDN